MRINDERRESRRKTGNVLVTRTVLLFNSRSRLSRDAAQLSIANLQRDRPLPVASVRVGEHHVCVESPEHVAKTIAFNGGILNTDGRTVVLHPRYDYGSVNYICVCKCEWGDLRSTWRRSLIVKFATFVPPRR